MSHQPAHATRLGHIARECLDEAVRAVDPRRAVRQALEAGADRLDGLEGRIRLAALGKAGVAMARGARDALGDVIREGVVVVPEALAGEARRELKGFRVHGGGHPIPTEGSAQGAADLLQLARTCREGDLLLVLVSGGGSALATLPPEGVTLDALQETTGALLRAGASIGELNCVRKHLDRLKGGRLAAAAAPATVLALVVSDVVGDPLDVIASGPVTPDPTTFEEALAILERRGILETLEPSVRAHLDAGRDGEIAESPKPGDTCFDAVATRIVASNRDAARAALEAAKRHGFATRLLTTTLEGEAREVGRFLAAEARDLAADLRPGVLLAAGETTVTVRGDGLGGRNQELALAAVEPLDGAEDILLAAFGTDGVDGPTDAAGAMVDGSTAARARAAGLDPREAIERSDSSTFFAELDDRIVTGPTGTNVMDLTLLLVDGPRDAETTPSGSASGDR